MLNVNQHLVNYDNVLIISILFIRSIDDLHLMFSLNASLYLQQDQTSDIWEILYNLQTSGSHN